MGGGRDCGRPSPSLQLSRLRAFLPANPARHNPAPPPPYAVPQVYVYRLYATVQHSGVEDLSFSFKHGAPCLLVSLACQQLLRLL